MVAVRVGAKYIFVISAVKTDSSDLSSTENIALFTTMRVANKQDIISAMLFYMKINIMNKKLKVFEI